MYRYNPIIILAVLFGLCGSIYAQRKIDYCAFLQKTIENKAFGWNFCKDTDIVLVDTAKIFKNCTSMTQHGRKVQIVDSCPSYFAIQRNRATQEKLKNNDYTKIVVLAHDGKHGKVQLYFWRPLTNSTALFEVKRRFGTIHVKLLSAGDY